MLFKSLSALLLGAACQASAASTKLYEVTKEAKWRDVEYTVTLMLESEFIYDDVEESDI